MLLLGCFGATSAAAQTQQALSRVSLDAPDATVITVFQAIQQQTGCSFVYNTSDIDKNSPPPQRSGRRYRSHKGR